MDNITFIIETDLWDFYFKPIGDGTGILSGDKILSPNGVSGMFMDEPEVGERVVFLALEPCILRNNELMVELDAMNGILIGVIKNIYISSVDLEFGGE